MEQQKETTQKIVQDYFLLVEKSQQLFAGLRWVKVGNFGVELRTEITLSAEIYLNLGGTGSHISKRPLKSTLRYLFTLHLPSNSFATKIALEVPTAAQVNIRTNY